MRPPSSTRIWSACRTVFNRCAIITTVLRRVSSSMAACSSSSFSGSTFAVASSNSTMGASFSSARAMEMRCFSPPDTVAPPSPSIVA